MESFPRPILLVADAIEVAADRDGDAIALALGPRTVSYAELDRYANALAFALLRRGLEPGERVAVLLDAEEAVVALWAVAKAGLVCVPLGPADVQSGALVDLSVRAFIVDTQLMPTFQHAVARAPKLRCAIAHGVFDAASAAGVASYVDYDTALAEEDGAARPDRTRIDLDDGWIARRLDRSAYLALSQRALLSRGGSLARGLDLAAGDALAGGSLPETAIACALAGVALGWPADRKRSLWIDDGGDVPDGATVLRLHNPTECGPIALLGEGEQPGAVLPNIDLQILDDEGRAAGPRVVGEIVVRTSGMFSQWVHGDEGSPPAIHLRLGESGMMDEAGGLYLLR